MDLSFAVAVRDRNSIEELHRPVSVERLLESCIPAALRQHYQERRPATATSSALAAALCADGLYRSMEQGPSNHLGTHKGLAIQRGYR
jgi:hypothetical protein